jgi:hypothetical protein
LGEGRRTGVSKDLRESATTEMMITRERVTEKTIAVQCAVVECDEKEDFFYIFSLGESQVAFQ